MKGVQFAGLGNIALGDVTGFQAAGLANYAGRTRSIQVAGLANYTTNLCGAQLSAVNVVNEGSGLQAGVVNVAGPIIGVQSGLLNIAGSIHGVQVGLVNIADDMEGLPIGLVSIERGGIQKFEAWVDSGSDTGPMISLGAKLGTRHTYTLIETGYVLASSPIGWSFGLGLGGRINVGGVFVDSDIAWRSIVAGNGFWNDVAVKQQPEMRAVLGIPIMGFSIIAGAAVDAHIPGIWKSEGEYVSSLELVPRFVLGIQF